MEQLQLDIEAIRTMMKVSRKEMAELLDITLDRYNRLATGESKMLATELKALHKVSKVPYDSIVVQS